MPWRDLLSPAQRAQVMELPTRLREYEEFYTLTPADQEFVAAHRTSANRLGVAVQLCFLRHPGRAWTAEETIPTAMLRFIAQQVGAEPTDLLGYAERDQTRREHAVEMTREYGFTTFGGRDYGRTAGSHAREPTASRQWAEPRGCCHRALEHGLLGARGHCDSPEWTNNTRRDAYSPLTAQVGAHQPDGRLSLAQGCRARKPQGASPPPPLASGTP